MKKYFGSCLCKEVSFEVLGEFKRFFLCHCSRCRKETGSAHAANLFSKTAELQWTRGKENVTTFLSAGTRFARAFCKSCGSALPVVGEGGGLVVPAGSLDCDVDIAPDAHIFIGSKANWDHDFDLVTKFDELPVTKKS